jgi:hypothetical protein
MILLTKQSTIPLYMTWYNNLYGMTPIQQRIYLLDDTWYSNLYIMILDTAISAINLQQWFSKLSYALKDTLIQNTNNLSLQLIYDMTLRILSMNKATACPLLEDPPPMRIPGAARRTPRHYPRLWISCYYIVFFCFAICVTRYPLSEDP